MTQKLVCHGNNIKVTKEGRIDCIEEGHCPKTKNNYCFRPDCLESITTHGE